MRIERRFQPHIPRHIRLELQRVDRPFYTKMDKSMLKAYTNVFSTVETDSTFYRYPDKGTVMVGPDTPPKVSCTQQSCQD